MRQVCQIISDREQASIMSHVLLEGGKEGLRFTAINEDTQITSRVSCNLDEKFARTLPARRLASICQNLPDDAEMTFQFLENKVELKSSVGSSKYTLNCLPTEEFYQLNMEGDEDDLSEAPSLELPKSDFLYLINKTQSCMGVADVRQYLNGALLDVSPERIRMVATDGNRMAVCDRPIKGKSKHQVIVSRHVIERLPKILHGKEDENMSLSIGNNFIRLNSDNITICTRLVKGQYPNYEGAMPKAVEENMIMIPRTDFLYSLKRVDSIMSSSSTHSRGIRMSLSDKGVNLSSANSLGEKAESSFPMPDKHDGPVVNMAFNVDFMYKVLDGLSSEENIRLFIQDPVSSFLILPEEGQETQYVIMPMRL